MKRVLCLVSSMNAGGAETFLMKLYRQLDRTRYQMDFCVNIREKGFYDDEIKNLGGEIFYVPPKSEDIKAFKRELAELIRQKGYPYVLRITSNAMGFLDLKVAKQAGAKVCIARSSNSSDGKGWKPWIAHRLGRLLYNRHVDVRIAPSDLAAEYTFGKNACRNGMVKILHNAVDTDMYRYDELGRTTVRQELGISEDALLVGHVGRLTTQKNHSFLLKVFAELLKSRQESMLLLVGKGELKEQLVQQTKELGIADKVIFAGVRSDIPQLLSAMDVFVFPSLYEGMPNTVIEAQATGLPCVISDTITRQADITGRVNYLPLSCAETIWAEAAVDAVSMQRQDTKQAFMENGYDVKSTAKRFAALIFEHE